MIESLIDFKVVLVLADQMNHQINQCFYDDKKVNDENDTKNPINKPKTFKTNFNPTTQLPWTLIKHLENNFVCREIDLKLKQTMNFRILPSILINKQSSIKPITAADNIVTKIKNFQFQTDDQMEDESKFEFDKFEFDNNDLIIRRKSSSEITRQNTIDNV